MGGSGGGGIYSERRVTSLRKAVDEARESAQKERFDSDVNRLLRETLSSFERDPDTTQNYLDRITTVLKDEAEIEQLLFGGSVAKHTYVDGLSDVDALVVLNKKELEGQSPQQVLDLFFETLQNNLTYDTIKSVDKGRMAVTVTHRDGIEIQLLPAVRRDKSIGIPNAKVDGWKYTDPARFQRMLTQANIKMNNLLVPTIKLVKSIIAGLPEQKRLSGYHIEALSIDAVRDYRGPKTAKDTLIHIFEHSSKRVLTPIEDVTHQTNAIDEDLGKANSVQRKIVSDGLASVARRLKAATTISQWKDTLEQ